MMYEIKPLSQKHALEIANEWKYEGEYAFYDMTEDLDDYNEFIDEKERENTYEFLYEGKLIGYFLLIQNNCEVEIGLGLKSEYCGQGIGKRFIRLIEEYALKRFYFNTFKMNVAAFNTRAIACYQSCGYQKTREIMQKTNGGEYLFVEMIKQLDDKRICR